MFANIQITNGTTITVNNAFITYFFNLFSLNATTGNSLAINVLKFNIVYVQQFENNNNQPINAIKKGCSTLNMKEVFVAKYSAPKNINKTAVI